MKERPSSFFLPSEKGYHFSSGSTSPDELRTIIDTAPEAIVLDKKFQKRVIDFVFFSLVYDEQSDVNGLLSVVNGFAARGITEAEFDLESQELIVERLTDFSERGEIKKFERMKNIFRTVSEDTISQYTEIFEKNLLNRLVYQDEANSFSEYVSILRRILPNAFSEQNILQFVASDSLRFVKFASNPESHLPFWWNCLKEIPEIQRYVPNFALEMLDAIRRGSINLAYDSDKTWEELFGKTVTEMGLEYEVSTAILQTNDSVFVDLAILKKFLEFFGMPQVVHATQESVDVACRVLCDVNLVRDSNPKAELLEYMKLLGIDGSTMLESNILRQRWSKLIATDLNVSDNVVGDFTEIVDPLSLDELGRRSLGLRVGFALIKKGNFGAAAKLHQALGLSYVGDSGDIELTNAMQSETLLAVYRILTANDEFSTRIHNLIAFETASGIDRASLLSKVLVPSLKLYTQTRLDLLCTDILSWYTWDKKKDGNEFVSALVEAMANDQELITTIQDREANKDRLGVNRIATLIEIGLLSKSFIYGSVRQRAIVEFVSGVTVGDLKQDLSDLFRITESDISLEEFQKAAQAGVANKMNDHGSQIDSLDGFVSHDTPALRISRARRFANDCGISGEYLTASLRQGLIKSVTSDDYGTFLELLKECGVEQDSITGDVEFQSAIKKNLARHLMVNVKSALEYITVFRLENDKSAIHEAIYQAWIRKNSVITDVIDYFPEHVLDRSFGEMALRGALASKTIKIDSVIALNNYYTPPLHGILYRTEQIFGSFADWKSYDYLEGLLEKNTIAEELQELGITRTGEAGMMQLKEQLQNFSQRIVRGEVTSTELEASTLLLGYYMDKTRVEITEWGRVNGDAVLQTIKRSERFHTEHPDPTFADRYKPSAILKIGTTKGLKEFVFEEDFLNRYRFLTGVILKAANDCNPLDKPLSRKVEVLDFQKEQVIATLENKLTEEPSQALVERAEKEARKKGDTDLKDEIVRLLEVRNSELQKSITVLRSVSLRGLVDVQDNFVTLAQYKELQPLLLEIIFTFAFMQREHRGEAGNDMDTGLSGAAEVAVAGREPTLDGVTWTLNFIDHIVNREVMAKYFTNKFAARLLRQIASVAALEKQLPKMTATADVTKTSMQFIPTRGTLLEFSGQIGDACWASKYQCIAEKFPNFTSVIMVGKPETTNEKLAGSALLIETMSATGEPLLVIRGFNPIENVINKLQVEDFYNAFTTWAGEQATRMGRKLAIVIDGYSGGSATNRPVLFQYLSSKTKELQRISLYSSNDTTFNGYDIVDNVYLVHNHESKQ